VSGFLPGFAGEYSRIPSEKSEFINFQEILSKEEVVSALKINEFFKAHIRESISKGRW